MLTSMTPDAREKRARRAASCFGYRITQGPDRYGNRGYFVVDSGNWLVSSEWAMDLDELEAFLAA